MVRIAEAERSRSRVGVDCGDGARHCKEGKRYVWGDEFRPTGKHLANNRLMRESQRYPTRRRKPAICAKVRLCGCASPAKKSAKVMQEMPILLATSRSLSSDSLT
jgi:CRISPR/Cas system Type II protein with McrA/HNH and RuvC-like nuclease domain